MGLHMGPHTGFQMQGGAHGTETCGKPFHKSLFFRQLRFIVPQTL